MKYLPSPSSCLVALLFFSNVSDAIIFPINARRNPHVTLSSSLSRRGGNITPLTNTADVSYYANLTLNGQSFVCLIDTGSSDLWVAGSVPNAKDTGKTAGVTYAIDSVEGKIKTADLDFSGYSISDQAYIEVKPSDQNPEGKGLIGLGPNTGSNVYQALNNDGGRAVANRIFLQNTSTPNFISVNLGRIEDPDDPFPGNITIGEVLPGLDAVLSQPKIEVTEVSVHQSGNQHFQILIDADGIIGPDNQPINYTSVVSSSSKSNQATAVIDTGFSLSQVPKIIADKFYSRFEGAEYVNVKGIGNTWIVPCGLEVNMTWKIGGQNYPIHPLDTTLKPSIMGMSDGAVQNSNGDDCCIGMFQPISFDRGDDPTYDIILGMSFLRNVYALFDYGDFIEGSNKDRGDPYLQLLSTTDVPSSHLDFVEVRLNGDDTTGVQVLNAWDPSLESSDSSTTKKSSNSNSHLKIIFLALAITAGVLGGLILMWACCCRRSAPKGGKGGKGVKPNAGWMAYGGYGRVGDPNADAGPGAYPFQGLSSSNSNTNNFNNRQSQYDYQGETRYDPVPVHDSHGGPGNSNYAGVGLGRGDAPPYSPYDTTYSQGQGHGHGQSLYDPPPQTYNPRASSPSPGGYANPFESRR